MMTPKKRAFKYIQIKTDLSIQILEGQLRPHDRILSLNGIVDKYKVSKITARRVLNDLVAEGLVYATRGAGSFVADAASRRTDRHFPGAEEQLGVVFAHAAGTFMSDIILGIDEEAFIRNVQIALCLSNNMYEREAELLQRLARQGVKRILIFMVLQFDSGMLNPNIPLYLRLQERGIRLLFLVCYVQGCPLSAITYDEHNAYRRLVKFMKDKGRKRLACVTRNDNASSTIERLRGFKDGLLDNGMPFLKDHILQVPIASHDTVVSDTARHFASFLRQGNSPDAIICSDEMVAGGVFDAIDTCGLNDDARPIVGGMGIVRNLHILKNRHYLLLEEDTRRVGREAAALILGDKFPQQGEMDAAAFHQFVPVPIRIPKNLK
ncbi:MAG: LacI family DNA-binding transcriptional regulator [bacterium]|nr:LacI family DNA-binding transcriptional regulator [Candidatus Sumerlaeota bacterium]